MITALVCLGLANGFIGGFFGIGGGTLLVPALMYLGLDIKYAIGISVMQMVFASLFGSYLNFRKGVLNLREGLFIGIGGFIGALGSGYIVSTVPSRVLELLFLAFVGFALYRFFVAVEPKGEAASRLHPLLLGFLGVLIGLFSISIGVGGSVLLTPVLVGFLDYPLKRAVSAGLFFVAFSSVAGFVSLSVCGQINYLFGLIVGLSSLVGVFLGIKMAHKTEVKRLKSLLVLLYIVVLAMIVKKIVF